MSSGKARVYILLKETYDSDSTNPNTFIVDVYRTNESAYAEKNRKLVKLIEDCLNNICDVFDDVPKKIQPYCQFTNQALKFSLIEHCKTNPDILEDIVKELCDNNVQYIITSSVVKE